MIGLFCGTDHQSRSIFNFGDNTGVFTSSGNKLYVKFTTDYSGRRKGFEARFNSFEPAGKPF